ncbi:MAG: two pore domain potassium channel family protein [Bacteroidales bacterium]|nr:two pore domain potassium channel family protein [Bacteroidales bacterium]
MSYSFESYRVEITDRQFTRSDGYTTPKTARVVLLNDRLSEIATLNLAYPNLADVYEGIGKGETINLDCCLVQSFSATACKRYLGLDKSSLIPLLGLSAQNAFFESGISIDFSLVDFRGDVNFNNSYMVAPLVDFHQSTHSNGNFSLSDCHIRTEHFNFTQCRFYGSNMSFKNTTFSPGEKDFQDCVFNSNDTLFTNTDFGNGNASFINVKFGSSEINFKVARFGTGKVDFHYANFGRGDVSFERTEFGPGRVDFRTVDFGTGRVSFNRSVFGDGEVNFEGAEVKAEKLTFKRASFGTGNLIFDLFQGDTSDLVFERTIFSTNLSFHGARLNNLLMEDCQFNSMLNLHVEKCASISLPGCTIRDIAEFYTHGSKPMIDMLNISGVKLLGKLYIDDEACNLKQLIYNQTDTTCTDKAEQFRILKENFNDLGRYKEEDRSYVEFKRCEAKARLQRLKSKGFLHKIAGYVEYAAKKLIFDYMGLYATAPQRVIVSILVVYSLYSLSYALIMLMNIGIVEATGPSGAHLGLVAKGFYFSVVTFFTIGYGDFAPDGFARIIAGTEGFMGVFMMSYFTVAFVRKILR